MTFDSASFAIYLHQWFYQFYLSACYSQTLGQGSYLTENWIADSRIWRRDCDLKKLKWFYLINSFVTCEKSTHTVEIKTST
jgi:hypothetical protein